jgi:hypothetical protein
LITQSVINQAPEFAKEDPLFEFMYPLNSSSTAYNTLTARTIKHIISVYNEMKSNNSTGGFTKITTVAMQALFERSSWSTGRNMTALPNSLDFSDILKFGTLGAGIGCGIGPNRRGDFADIMRSRQCVAGALGAAAVKLVNIS